MVECRLRKRMTDLGIETPEAYLEHLRLHELDEGRVLTSLLTTHHTYFFREYPHFQFLQTAGLAEVAALARARKQDVLRVLSAGCSRGQEAYSLAMFLELELARVAPGMRFEILGIDIDPDSIHFAKNGVYRWDEVKEIPLAYRSDHLVRGTGKISEFVKVRDSLKKTCSFEAHNLLKVASALNGQSFDLIFCRNVFIYFSPEQVERTVSELMAHLRPGGFIFTGIAESLSGTGLKLASRGPSIYQDAASAPAPGPARPLAQVHALPVKVRTPAAQTPAPSVATAEVWRVLCVDDSPTILQLLKQILTPETGFEVVATAANGAEAAEVLTRTPVDVMTLDIHMPVQNGIEYLEKHLARPDHPPVVMMSSVSREDASLGARSLELGASDFIEKPKLSQIKAHADEVRIKLRSAIAHRAQRGAAPVLSLDQAFKKRRVIQNASRGLQIAVLRPGDLGRLKSVTRYGTGEQPPLVIFTPGTDTILEAWIEKLKADSYSPRLLDSGATPSKLETDMIYLAPFDGPGGFEKLREASEARPTAIWVFGDHSQAVLDPISRWQGAQVIVEDLGQEEQPHHAGLQLRIRALEYVPLTSFEYLSEKFFSEKLGQ